MEIKEHYLLSQVTRFGIGGPADFFAHANTLEEVQVALAFAKGKNIPVTVIGEGSNLLVSDEGYRGLIIQVGINKLEWDLENNKIVVGAGVNLLAFISQACARGLAGMENMYGIPGNIGAAVYGNVGAYGTEIKDLLIGVKYWSGSEVKSLSNAECQFEYRSSIFKQHKDWIILEAELQLAPGADADLIAKCQDIMAQREVKYPAGMKCPGSYFKNIKISTLNDDQAAVIQPFAEKVKGGKLASGILIQAAGGNGLSVGDAKVADYHGNLIYNDGHATANDVRELADTVKGLVKDKFGILLEEEVQYL